MTEDIPRLSSQARALLERERPIPALSPAVRSRAMAAARGALAAGPLPVAPPRPPAAWTRWAAAAALTCAASAAVAAIAYRHHDLSAPVRPLVAPGAVVAPVEADIPSPAPIGQADPQLATAPSDTAFNDTGAPPSRAPVPREELRLLRQARGAVARDDFAAALPPIAQHAREFPTGRLAEEREALRVKALVGLGRSGEARRAANGFEARFPRSVLLPAIRRMSASGGDDHR